MADVTKYVAALADGPLFDFAAWPNRDIPAVCAGAYSIWEGDQLVYVGMAGRSLTEEAILRHRDDPTKVTGLRDRLGSHASGARGGDQFCLYVADLILLPTLTQEQIRAIAQREIRFDHLVRGHVRENFSYRYVVIPDGSTARAVEREGRAGLNGSVPVLNPRR